MIWGWGGHTIQSVQTLNLEINTSQKKVEKITKEMREKKRKKQVAATFD